MHSSPQPHSPKPHHPQTTAGASTQKPSTHHLLQDALPHKILLCMSYTPKQQTLECTRHYGVHCRTKQLKQHATALQRCDDGWRRDCMACRCRQGRQQLSLRWLGEVWDDSGAHKVDGSSACGRQLTSCEADAGGMHYKHTYIHFCHTCVAGAALFYEHAHVRARVITLS